MIHFFDVEIATKYGVNAAILLQNIAFWIRHNEANNANLFDDKYWTFNSRKAFHVLFPYMSEKQIYGALQKLLDEGLIIKGNYNKESYDRTLWYALTEKGQCIVQNGTMDCPKWYNGLSEKGQPIPDINTDINTDNKHRYTEEVEIIVSYLNEKAGTKYRANTESTRRHIVARLNDSFTVDDFKVVIDKKCAEWKGSDYEKFLRPETLFGSKFESYLNQKSKEKEVNPYAGIDADCYI